MPSATLLLGLLGGFILGPLAFLIIVPGMTVLAIANALARRRLPTLGLDSEGATCMVAPSVCEAPVVARVIASQGACPLGYGFQIGDEWALNHEARGSVPLCPVAHNRLLEARTALQREKHVLEITLCQTEEHSVGIEVSRVSSE